jgi:hypothetical protein
MIPCAFAGLPYLPPPEGEARSLQDALWVYLTERAELRAGFLRSGRGPDEWLWRNYAPPSAPLPVAVLVTAGEGDYQTTLKDGHTFEVAVQITVYGSEAEAVELGGLIDEALLPRKDPPYERFSWSPTVGTGYEMTRWPSPGNATEEDPDRGRDGAPVYARRVHWTFLCGRSYS